MTQRIDLISMNKKELYEEKYNFDKYYEDVVACTYDQDLKKLYIGFVFETQVEISSDQVPMQNIGAAFEKWTETIIDAHDPIKEHIESDRDVTVDHFSENDARTLYECWVKYVAQRLINDEDYNQVKSKVGLEDLA